MHPALLIFHIGWGIISWTLYLRVTQYIYRHKKQFNSAFTRLWNTFTVVNLFQYLTMKVYYQIPLHISIDSSFATYLSNFPHQLPLTLLYSFAYYFLFCQRLCILLIIGISFRIIVFPFSSSPFWERKYIFTVITIFCVPIPFLLQVFFSEPSYNYVEYMDGFVLFPSISRYPGNAIRNMKLSSYFEIFTASLAALLKLSSLLCLSTSKIRKRDDRNLYVITTILFATSLLKFACAFLMVKNLNTYLQMVVIYMYPIFADMVALSCPYTLLYINRKMRSHILPFCCVSELRQQRESTNGTSV